MKYPRFLILCFLILFYLEGESQFSIKGTLIAGEYSNAPLSGVDIYLIEQDKLIKSDSNGEFSFYDLELGTYTLKITPNYLMMETIGFQKHKYMIKNILLPPNNIIDTLDVLPAIYSYRQIRQVFGSDWDEELLRSLYKDIGDFLIDTTKQYYDHGLYQENRIIESSLDSLKTSPNSLYRQGEWVWKFDSLSRIEHYDKGKLHGTIIEYYDNGMINYIGKYNNNKRHGQWSFFDYVNTGNEFTLDFLDDYLIIDLGTMSIQSFKYINQRIIRVF